MKALIAALIGLSASLASAQLKIVTTTTDFADIARQVGGDKVDVHSVMKGPENVHNVLAKPTEMAILNKADLFVHSGLDSEPWRDNLLRGARNPRVLPDRPGSVDMSNGIELKEVPTRRIDRSQGDVHAYGNPHYSLNPQTVQRMTVTLAKAMSAADPANAKLYTANAENLINEMADISREIRRDMAPFAGLKVVTFHPAWLYFADAIPIEILGTIEPKPAITPSAAQVQQTVEMMKAKDVKVVICETYNDTKLAQYVADRAGAKMVVLPDHVNGVPGTETYQKLFRYDVAKLIEAAKAAGVVAAEVEHAP
jgi:zinc/manganese transport system substrate-binding protein